MEKIRSQSQMLCETLGKSYISLYQWLNLIVRRPEEEIAALGEKSELAGNPIFQDDFMNEGYITDDVLDDPLDEVKLVEFFEM